jgi:hypothetical protein
LTKFYRRIIIIQVQLPPARVLSLSITEYVFDEIVSSLQYCSICPYPEIVNLHPEGIIALFAFVPQQAL